VSTHFYSKFSPSMDEISELESITPYSLFNSRIYADACAKIGEIPCILALKNDSGIIEGCLGFFSKAGLLWRKLMIYSAPNVSDPQLFWTGVKEFCRKQGVWDLEIENLFTDINNIPNFKNVVKRNSGFQYILDLDSNDLKCKDSRNHRRNINHAREAGFILHRKNDYESCLIHLKLRQDTMERRKNRGEDVNIPTNMEYYNALLESKAGELFQVTDGKNILSSGLVGKFRNCAYWHATGTSPEGMNMGAAHFLFNEVSKILKEEGISTFNWGATYPDNPGLMRFKAGFGARKEPLDIVTFSMKHPIMRKFRTAICLLKQNPISFLAAIVKIENYVVFKVDPEKISDPGEFNESGKIIFRKLTDEELIKLHDDGEFYQHAGRYQRLNYNSAYGIFDMSIKKELVCICWLFDSELDKKNKYRKAKLRLGEGEICDCLTSVKYRGKGYYPYAIKKISMIAAQTGYKKIYMLTDVKNISSQRGIEKVGFTRCGKIWQISFPFIYDKFQIILREFRALSFFESVKMKFFRPPSA
jgi:hypothetical protein